MNPSVKTSIVFGLLSGIYQVARYVQAKEREKKEKARWKKRLKKLRKQQRQLEAELEAAYDNPPVRIPEPPNSRN